MLKKQMIARAIVATLSMGTLAQASETILWKGGDAVTPSYSVFHFDASGAMWVGSNSNSDYELSVWLPSGTSMTSGMQTSAASIAAMSAVYGIESYFDGAISMEGESAWGQMGGGPNFSPGGDIPGSFDDRIDPITNTSPHTIDVTFGAGGWAYGDTGNNLTVALVVQAAAATEYSGNITVGTTFHDGGSGTTGYGAGFGGTGPNASGAFAAFDQYTGSTVQMPSGTTTLGQLYINKSSPVTITGNAIALDNGSGQGTINVLGGVAHTIASNLTLSSDTTVFVDGSTTLNATGTVSSSGKDVKKVGGGTLALTRFTADKLTIADGTVKSTAAAGTASKVNSLVLTDKLSSNAPTLDLTTKGAGFIIDAADAAEATRMITAGELGNVVDPISNAFNASTVWSGKADADKASITSTALASDFQRRIGYATTAQLGVTSFLGESVDSSAVVTRVVLGGDSNLDAEVNFDDYLKLAQNYSATIGGRTWFQGDFNYDGFTNSDDLFLLSQNYEGALLTTNQTRQLSAMGGSEFAADLAMTLALVPEPTTMMLGLPLAAFIRRRRN